MFTVGAAESQKSGVALVRVIDFGNPVLVVGIFDVLHGYKDQNNGEYCGRICYRHHHRFLLCRSRPCSEHIQERPRCSIAIDDDIPFGCICVFPVPNVARALVSKISLAAESHYNHEWLMRKSTFCADK